MGLRICVAYVAYVVLCVVYVVYVVLYVVYVVLCVDVSGGVVCLVYITVCRCVAYFILLLYDYKHRHPTQLSLRGLLGGEGFGVCYYVCKHIVT